MSFGDGKYEALDDLRLWIQAPDAAEGESTQSPKTRRGSAISAASPKLRTCAHKNCEPAVKACSQFPCVRPSGSSSESF